VQKRDNRPLLKRADAKAHLSNLVTEREPFYSQADLNVQSKDGPHTNTVNAILKALQTWTPT
jgi:shikimate kinase